MKIKRGAMRTQIEIQKATPGGALGQPQWSTFAIRRAEKRSTTGRAQAQPQTGGSEVDTEFVFGYLKGVNAGMRVVIAGDSSHYPIKYVVTETPGQPMLTHLFCREVLSA
jgi:hypothetical protein